MKTLLNIYLSALESDEAQALFSVPVVGSLFGVLALVPIGFAILLVFALAMCILSAPDMLNGQ